MTTKSRICIWFAAVALTVAASAPAGLAADVTVTARIEPATVPVGNEAVLTVLVEGKFRRTASPQLPDLDDLYIYESGTSQSFRVINGEMSASISFTYVLSPQKEGTFTVAPITFTVGDTEYTADPVTLTATAATSSITPGTSSRPAPDAADGALPGEDQSIYISATTDRDTVYVDQQVTWTLGYYTDGRITLLRSPNYSPPQAEGFWVEDLPPQKKYYTMLHGRQYLINEIKRAYFPTAPGVYEIGEAKVDLVIDNVGNRSLLDDFFSRSFRTRGFGQSRSLLTEPREVVVLPLPTRGKPADFSGVVAEDLGVSIAADKQVAQVGEPINVSIEVDVVGNVRSVPAPALEESDRYKVYESGSSSDTFKKDYVVSGRKTYDFVVIPQVEGKWQIPAVEVSYFDPGERHYTTARSRAIPLDIKPGTAEDGRKVIYAGGGDDIEVISRDIRYIRPATQAVSMASSSLARNGVYLALHAIPLLAVMVSLVTERRRRRLRSDRVYARASRALREAEKRLANATRDFRDGDVDAGYTALSAALNGYFADKMNASPAGLTTDTIVEFLDAKGAGADTASAVRAVLAECDAARYAAGASSADAGGDAAERAAALLRGLEKGALS